MRTENEIREMLAILRCFNDDHRHDKEIMALSWVLGEYPVLDDREAEDFAKRGAR